MGEGAVNPASGPWPFEKHFAGWIPCATGHLSFSLFGKERYFSTANISCGDPATDLAPTRHVFVAQRREAHDLLIPAWVLRHIIRYHRVASDYYLVAETEAATHPVQNGDKLNVFQDKLGCLKGKIFIVVDQATSKLHHKRNRFYKNSIRAAERTHAQYVNQEDAFADSSIFTAFMKDLSGAIADDLVALEFDVRIYRTGETRIHPVEESFPDNDYEGDAVASKCDYIRAMASQAYYFVKDAGHRHYHHNHKQDNALPIMAASASDDESWRRETMWSLVRAVLNSRRKPKIDDLCRAMGISAYASAFQCHLGGHRRSAGDFNKFELIDVTSEYDLEFLNSSLEARVRELNWVRTNRLNLFYAAIATVISTVALWLTSAQWLSARSGESGHEWPIWIETTLRHFVASPEIIIVLGIMAYLVFAVTITSKMPIFRPILQMTQVIIDNTYYSISRVLHVVFGDPADIISSLLRIIFMMFLSVFFADLFFKSIGLSPLFYVWDYISKYLP